MILFDCSRRSGLIYLHRFTTGLSTSDSATDRVRLLGMDKNTVQRIFRLSAAGTRLRIEALPRRCRTSAGRRTCAGSGRARRLADTGCW